MRPSSPVMDEMIGKVFDIEDLGYIRVIDYMGTDNCIVEAARLSYGKGTRAISDDRKVLRHLFREGHTSPFEMCELKIDIFLPMDAWRQGVRHRTFSVNEYSTRYSLAIEDKATTKPNKWRTQSINNKQGSCGFLDPIIGDQLTIQEHELHEHIEEVYKNRLELGVAREQARKDLPLSNYTLARVKVDIHNLLHFLSLRMDTHAQLEIRRYANIIGNEIIAKWLPFTWEAFNDYDFRREGKLFSRMEMQILRDIITLSKLKINEYPKPDNLTEREFKEFLEKIT